MKVAVLKDFLVAVDEYGVKTRALVAGTVDEVADDIVAGLVDEGYVSLKVSDATDDGGHIVPAPAAPATEIPADWQTLHHKTRVALAKKISGSDGLTTEQADTIIADEVARRAGPPPASDDE